MLICHMGHRGHGGGGDDDGDKRPGGGPEPGPEDGEARDAADAESLYRLLETEVAPLYYEREPAGLPRKWLRVVRRAIEIVAPHFSARRMLKQYVERLYLPAWLSRAGESMEARSRALEG